MQSRGEDRLFAYQCGIFQRLPNQHLGNQPHVHPLILQHLVIDGMISDDSHLNLFLLSFFLFF